MGLEHSMGWAFRTLDGAGTFHGWAFRTLDGVGTFLGWAFKTLDGARTFHGMGIISAATPGTKHRKAIRREVTATL